MHQGIEAECRIFCKCGWCSHENPEMYQAAAGATVAAAAGQVLLTVAHSRVRGNPNHV